MARSFLPSHSPYQPTISPSLRLSLLLKVLCQPVPTHSSLSLYLVGCNSSFMSRLQSHFLEKVSSDPRQGKGTLLPALLVSLALIFRSTLPMMFIH